MGRSSQPVRVPGAPSGTPVVPNVLAAGAPPVDGVPGTGPDIDDDGQDDGPVVQSTIDPRAPVSSADAAMIADLQAQLAQANALLAAARAGNAMPSVVFEPDTPHGIQARAASKFNHITSGELHRQVVEKTVKLTSRHVLCKDGWYVNPYFDSREV